MIHMAVLMIGLSEMGQPLWQFSVHVSTDQFAKNFQKNFKTAAAEEYVLEVIITEKQDAQKCKIQIHVTSKKKKKTVITSKRRGIHCLSLLLSSAGAPLMMSVFFSPLIIAFACVLPL